jgi:hypothetical protein
MVNGSKHPHPIREKSISPGQRRSAAPTRAELVNCGQDTRITLADGSTIVLKGITRAIVLKKSALAAKWVR